MSSLTLSSPVGSNTASWAKRCCTGTTPWLAGKAPASSVITCLAVIHSSVNNELNVGHTAAAQESWLVLPFFFSFFPEKSIGAGEGSPNGQNVSSQVQKPCNCVVLNNSRHWSIFLLGSMWLNYCTLLPQVLENEIYLSPLTWACGVVVSQGLQNHCWGWPQIPAHLWRRQEGKTLGGETNSQKFREICLAACVCVFVCVCVFGCPMIQLWDIWA